MSSFFQLFYLFMGDDIYLPELKNKQILIWHVCKEVLGNWRHEGVYQAGKVWSGIIPNNSEGFFLATTLPRSQSRLQGMPVLSLKDNFCVMLPKANLFRGTSKEGTALDPDCCPLTCSTCASHLTQMFPGLSGVYKPGSVQTEQPQQCKD